MTKQEFEKKLYQNPWRQELWSFCEKNKLESKNEELEGLVKRALGRNNTLTPVEGVFFDHKPSLAYVEKQEGYKTWFIGCTTPFKVNFDGRLHDQVTITKAAFFEYIRSYPLTLLRPKKLLKTLSEIYRKGLQSCVVRLHVFQFAPFPGEIRRVLLSMAFAKNTNIYPFWPDFVGIILQTGYTYYQRGQDLCSEIQKDSEPFDEARRILSLAIERDRNPNMRAKYRLLKRLSWLLLIPKYKRIAKEFIRLIDLDKVRHDEADKYYAYRKKEYDTHGLPYEERIKWVNKVDEINKNYILE